MLSNKLESFFCALLVGGLVLSLTGCMWKSDHVKKVKELDAQVAGLRKEKGEVQQQLDAKAKALAKALKQRDSVRAKAKRLTQQLSELAQAHDACRKNVAALANKRGEMGARLQQALTKLQQLQAINQKRKAMLDKLRNSLKSMVNAGQLKVRMVKGLLVVQLSEKILFASGSSKLKSEGKEAVKQVTTLLKDLNRRWQVAGHTDNKGQSSFNWLLSSRRARAVLRVMLDNGMPPTLISAAGFGQYQPTAPNDTKENRALNRRTELMLLPDLSELQVTQGPSPLRLCQSLSRQASL